MNQLSIHCDWPFSWKPEVVSGYDNMKITYVIGISWLCFGFFIKKFWNRNGCTHSAQIKKFLFYGFR